MRLHVLGSSSLGNCYVLENGSDALLIEAGIRPAEVKRALGFDTRNVRCCLVSHEHADHARYAAQIAAMGIQVAAPDTLRLQGTPCFKAITPRKAYKAGGFRFYALGVEHDVPCYAYVVSHPAMGTLAFCTDTITLPYRIKGVNHWLIEANYSDELVYRNIESGSLNPAMRRRLLNSHMELGETLRVLRQQDLSPARNVVLLHLSDGNSDEAEFVRQVRSVAKCSTVAAKAGMVVELTQAPY